MMARRVYWVIALFLVAVPVQAQYAGAFSRVGFGARGIALGNAQAADVFGEASPWYNPALAPLAKGQSIEGAVSAMSFDRSLQVLQIGAPLQQRAGITAGLVHAAVSNIDGRDNSGFHTRNLSVDEFAGFLAFGLRFSNRLSAGINLQFFQSKLYDGLSARTVGVDLGFAYRASDQWAAALVLDDMLARYAWDGSAVGGSGTEITDNFPRRVRFGVVHTLQDGTWLITVEGESRFSSVVTSSLEPRILRDGPARVREETNLTLRETRFRGGMEMTPLEGFALRGGVEQLGPEVLGGLRPSAGFSAEHPMGQLRIRVDYAFGWEAQAGGRMHVVSMRFYL